MLCYTLSVYRPFNGRVGSHDPKRRPRSIPQRVEDLATAVPAVLESLRARFVVVGRLESTRRPAFALASWRGDRPDFDFPPQPRTDRAATLGSIQPRRAEEPGSW